MLRLPASLPPQELKETEELDIQLKVFNENKEEDSIELSHRLEDIRAEMEYPFAVIRTSLAPNTGRHEPRLMVEWCVGVYRPASFEEAFRSLHLCCLFSLGFSFCPCPSRCVVCCRRRAEIALRETEEEEMKQSQSGLDFCDV